MDQVELRIDAIKVGERAREDLGDVAGLAASIEAHGLLHPVVVDAAHNLIAGERRLEAHRLLGRDTVEVRVAANADELKRLDMELDENVQRQDFTPIEMSRAIVRRAEIAARLIGHEQGMDQAQATRMLHEPQRGKHLPINFATVSERTGVTRYAVARAVQHVKAVDHYPELEPADQVPAIDAARALDAADTRVRQQVRAALSAGSIKAGEVPTFVEAATRVSSPPPALVAAALAGGTPAVPEVDRIRNRARFIKALTVFESELALLSVEDARGTLEPADIGRAGRILADFRAWYGQLAEAGNALTLVR